MKVKGSENNTRSTWLISLQEVWAGQLRQAAGAEKE
jgi:hypothetical protein